MNLKNRARARKGRGAKPRSQSKTAPRQPTNGRLTATAGDSPVKRSDIYLAASIAAEKELPEESRQLIEAFDTLHAEWRVSGWSRQILSRMVVAVKAIRVDPLASIAFDLRQKANHEAALEDRVSNPAESNVPAVTGGGR